MAATDKIARQIRLGQSEDFDLANYDTARINTMVDEAFSSPIDVKEMVQYSFVVGGGKKVRQKYSASLGKDFKAALSSKGFSDDGGAFRDLGCQGTYKHQHNTDTDLITMHVFPFVTVAGGDAGGGDEGGGGYAEYEDTPISVVAEADLETFQQTVNLKVQSYGQKMSLMRMLKSIGSSIDKIDAKLVAMEALTPSEDALYQSVQDVPSKVEWLTTETQTMIDAGKLTAKEKAARRKQLSSKNDTLQAQIEQNAGKDKKLGKLKAILVKLNEQIAKLDAVSPIKRTIKHAAEIAELKYRKGAMQRKVDSNTASIDDMNELGRIEKKIVAMEEEQADLYWFEDPDLVETVTFRPKGGKKGAASGGGGGGGGGGGWATASTSKSSKSKGGGKKAGGKQANSFAALFD